MLGELRWQSRVLLVFGSDERASTFLGELDDAACELEERDMVTGYLAPGGESYIGDRSVSDSDADGLREGFRVGDNDFQLLLIGKDGGVKARYREPPMLSDVFALIDGMPMRRREIRSRPGPCKN